jgi:hypothetical protein
MILSKDSARFQPKPCCERESVCVGVCIYMTCVVCVCVCVCVCVHALIVRMCVCIYHMYICIHGPKKIGGVDPQRARQETTSVVPGPQEWRQCARVQQLLGQNISPQ